MQLKTIHALEGETRKVTNQWTAEASKRATTVSTSEWEYSGSGTLASEALASNVATVLLTPTDCGVLTNTVVLANGETLIAERLVEL